MGSIESQTRSYPQASLVFSIDISTVIGSRFAFQELGVHPIVKALVVSLLQLLALRRFHLQTRVDQRIKKLFQNVFFEMNRTESRLACCESARA
jgi:hypothetical protein